MAKETMTGFITEFRFFHQMQPVRPVSACAQALWHYLFYRANAAFWQFPLKIQANEIAGHADGQVLPRQQCAAAHARDAG